MDTELMNWLVISDSVTAAQPVLPCKSQKYPGTNRQVKQSADKTLGHIPYGTKGWNLILKANFISKEARSRKVILPRDFFHWESSLSFYNQVNASLKCNWWESDGDWAHSCQRISK